MCQLFLVVIFPCHLVPTDKNNMFINELNNYFSFKFTFFPLKTICFKDSSGSFM